MSIKKDIKRINEKSDDIGILTLYLHTDVSHPDLNNGEWQIHLKNELSEMKKYADNAAYEDEKKALQNLIDKLETRVDDLQRDLQKSLVIFASADEELWEEKMLQVPVSTALHWDKSPVTGQLEELNQRYPKAGVIVLQQTDVRFIDTELGEVKDEMTFSWDVNREDWVDYHNDSPPSATDTAKDQFQRRFEENKNRWYKSLAPRLAKEIKNRNLEGAYLVGSNEAVPELEQHMDSTHLMGIVTKNLGTSPSHEIVNEVYDEVV